MKVPLTWLKDYVSTGSSPAEIAAAFTQIGLMLDKPLDGSGVLDLEHRMDRSDWLSIVGCARDLAAFLNTPLKAPSLYNKAGKKPASSDIIKIKVETPHVRRFKTVVIRGVKVGRSPKWLRDRLTEYGIDEVNNIVDITNFCMVELGQPMHAQDIAKLKGQDITLRQAKKGEGITTLLGTDIKLDEKTFILSSGGKPTVIGGIVGGFETGVTKETKDIVLDAGNYDQSVIRRTSRRLKIINETVSRYDKFLDPRLCELAIRRAAKLILEIAGGTYYTNVDYYPKPVKPQSLVLRYSRLALLSGMQIAPKEAKRILKQLGYSVVAESSKSLEVEIPYFRTDVEVEDDLVADILRIGNYESIPDFELSTPVPHLITPKIYLFEDRLRNMLVAQGAHEHITSSLVKSDGQKSQVKLANSLSEDQNALRSSLLPALKKVLKVYPKHKLVAPLLFEIGKVFRMSGKDEYQELRQLSVVSIGPVADSLATLLSSLGITNYHLSTQGEIIVDKERVGEYEYDTYTLLTEALHHLYKPYKGVVSEYTNTTSLDISLVVPSSLKYENIVGAISQIKGHWLNLNCLDVSGLSTNENSYLIKITWDASSKSIQKDKAAFLKQLFKLGIKSKS